MALRRRTSWQREKPCTDVTEEEKPPRGLREGTQFNLEFSADRRERPMQAALVATTYSRGGALAQDGANPCALT